MTIKYFFGYDMAHRTSDFLVILGGLTLGRGLTSIWLFNRWYTQPRLNLALGAIVVVLALAAVIHPEMPVAFQYRDTTRWTGIFSNPNTFGLLMGVGLTIALGQTLLSSTRSFEGRFVHAMVISLFLVAVVIMFVGLINSYSRGAWAGTSVAVVYLIWIGSSARSRGGCLQTVIANRVLKNVPVLCIRGLAVLVLVLSILLFWTFRHSEQQVVRRIFSIFNSNDFSTVNRLVASDGALRMISDKPLVGHGWNRAIEVYRYYYIPADAWDFVSLRTNSYLMIGISVGIVGFISFGGLVWVSCFRSQGWCGSFSQRLLDQDETGVWVCRAALIVLLVGFWFDGGLLRFATGVTFWCILEFINQRGNLKDIYLGA